MSRRRFLGLFGCGLILLVLTASGLYAQHENDIDGFLAIALAQGAVYLVALGLIWRSTASRRAVILVLGVAAAMRIAILAAPPFLSSDVYRYVWDGRVTAAGINPYRYIPADPHLAPLRDAVIFPRINRSTYAPTIYPPASEVIFFAVTRISESVTAMKIAMVAFEAVAVLLLSRLLVAVGLPAVRIIVYAWHPLPVWEFAGSAHIDAAIVAFVALALWSRHRSSPPNVIPGFDPGIHVDDRVKPGHGAQYNGWLTGLALAAGTLTKIYPAVLFPALWRRWEWRMPAVFVAVVALAYLPFLGVGWGVFGFLPGYMAEEDFASGGGFYIWSVAKAMLPLAGVPDIAYLAAAPCLLAGLAVYLVLRREEAQTDVFGGALLGAAFTFLLSPHYPWYFAWLIVFACPLPLASLLWLTLASFLLYLVPVASQLVRDQHRLLVESVIYVPFLVLAAIDLWRRRCRG